jgi:hypothetical protein
MDSPIAKLQSCGRYCIREQKVWGTHSAFFLQNPAMHQGQTYKTLKDKAYSPPLETEKMKVRGQFRRKAI